MAKYRKKPVVIEAIRWTGENEKEIFDFVGLSAFINGFGELVIETMEGFMISAGGDYIIKGVNGEFYPCKPDVFEKTYEGVTDDGKTD